ncbi:MAG: MarR family winged helix-turn-helix transcriptional regulator [Fimbriimonadaceae bacterium]
MRSDGPLSLVAEAALFYETVAERLEPDLKAAGLTLGAFELLSAVHAARGRAHQAELARRLGISPPTLCEALRVAVREGWVLQEADPSDARVRRVRLTPAGSEALTRVLSALDRLEQEAAEALGAERAADLAASLREASVRLRRA